VAFVGQGKFPFVTQRRIIRTKFLVEHRDAFCTLVKHELLRARHKWVTIGQYPSIGCRLNAFSDIPWEEVAPWMIDLEYVQLYDYTKDWSRTPRGHYHLVYSCRQDTPDEDDRIVEKLFWQQNVAIVFHVLYRPNAKIQDPLPDHYLGYKVIDGDHDDTRYRDPRGVIVGLRCKGKALFNNPGSFVRKVPT
jgi:hypothetical protein